jgi:competence protein ComEC
VALPFLLILGEVLSVMVPRLPALWLVGAGLIGFLALTLWPDRGTIRPRLGLMALTLWCGFSLLTVHAALFGTPMLDWPSYGRYRVTVDDILDAAGEGPRLVVSAITPLEGAKPLAIHRARLTLSAPMAVNPGDVIEGPIRFAPVPAPILPNGFDTPFHAFFDGIGAYATSTRPPVLIAPGPENSPAAIIHRVRSAIADSIDETLAEPEAGVARSLINGDQSAVSDETRDVLANAGLAHVLSVSGLHLTLVALLAMGAVRYAFSPLSLPFSVKALGAIAALFASLIYFGLSGGNVAALRSTLMIVLVLGAVVLGRRAMTLRNVAFAAIIIILTDPASVFRASFQLSFAAVTGLVGAVELWPPKPGRSLIDRVLLYFRDLSLSSLVAGLSTLVFTMVHFRQTAPLGILANLLVLPLVGLVTMPMAALAALLMPLNWEALPLVVLGWSIDVMLALAHLISALSAGFVASPLLSPVALGIASAGLALFAIVETAHRLWGPVLVVLGVPLLALATPPDVVIADTTLALAVRGADGLTLVEGKPTSFAVRVWREAFLEPIPDAPPLSCEKALCAGESTLGFRYLVIGRRAADSLTCPAVDLIVTRRPLPKGCTAPTVVNPYRLRHGGTHALFWHPASRSFTLRAAVPPVSRPWRAVPP